MRLPPEFRVNSLHPNGPRNPGGTLKDVSEIRWVYSPSALTPSPNLKKPVLENGDHLDELLLRRQCVSFSFSFRLRLSLLRPSQPYYEKNDSGPRVNENNNIFPKCPPTTNTDPLISNMSSCDMSKNGEQEDSRHESKAAKSGNGGTANEESSVGLGLLRPWHEVKSNPFPICDSPLTDFKLPVYPLRRLSGSLVPPVSAVDPEGDEGESLPFPAYPITRNIPPKTVYHDM